MIDLMNIIFNSLKIKFDVLDTEYSTKDLLYGKEIDVYINLDCLYRKLLRINKPIYPRKEYTECLMSNIFNYIAHYRLYYMKRGILPTIYAYSSYPMHKAGALHSSKYLGYRTITKKEIDTTNSVYIKNLWNSVIEPLCLMSEYFKNIYIIQSGELEPSTIPYILDKKYNRERPKVLITDQLYEYQYINDKFHILNPSSKSFRVFDKDNIMRYIYNVYKSESKDYISPLHIPVIISILGDEIRNIKGFYGLGIGRITSIIKKSETNISYDKPLIESILPLIKKDYIQDVISNYNVSYIPFLVNSLFESDKYFIYNQIRDIEDGNSIEEIIQRFDSYPIEINYLTGGIREKVKW